MKLINKSVRLECATDDELEAMLLKESYTDHFRDEIEAELSERRINRMCEAWAYVVDKHKKYS